jgi:3D (Asp-Asp-Asp) domain-containing protein
MNRNLARMILILSFIALAVIVVSLLVTPVNADSATAEEPKEDDGRIPGDDVPATERCYMTDEEVQESFENENIQNALLAKANKIEDCTVTWYTEATCGKTPDNPAYGITASGLPVVEHLTVAVDRSVIPLYSDVFVQYADGTIEQLWATDTGVNGNHIDIYTPDYDYAIQMGRQQLTVWWVEAD